MIDRRINEALGTEVAYHEQETTTECLYHAVEDAQENALLRWMHKPQIHTPILSNMVNETVRMLVGSAS